MSKHEIFIQWLKVILGAIMSIVLIVAISNLFLRLDIIVHLLTELLYNANEAAL